MDYTRHYNRLIERTRGRKRRKTTYFEEHHVLPRCLGGADDSINLVFLTPEEHYVAHQLLVKMHPGHYGILYAAVVMTRRHKDRVFDGSRQGNKLYGWLRRQLSEHMRANNPNAGGHSRRRYLAQNGPIQFRNYSLSPEGKDVLVKRMLGQRNPMSGIDPWRHPRTTKHTEGIWSKADEYYRWWKRTGRSYHRMSRDFGFEKPTMTHHNIYKKFVGGWIPLEDPNWVEFFSAIQAA